MMTDTSILLNYGGQKIEDLPPKVRRRIESRPRLRQAFEAQARVAALVALKRYETPDPALEGRLSHRVELRIRQRDFPLEDASPELLPEWLRMVAVVVFMLGLSVFTHREMLSSEAPEVPRLADGGQEPSSPFPPPLSEQGPFRHLDPFTTLVSQSDGTAASFSSPLQLQVQEAFDIRPLLETNRMDRLSLLPVRNSLP